MTNKTEKKGKDEKRTSFCVKNESKTMIKNKDYFNNKSQFLLKGIIQTLSKESKLKFPCKTVTKCAKCH